MSPSKDAKDYPVFPGPGLYNIINSATGNYLDLFESNPAAGTKIIGYPGTGNDNQKWEIVDVGKNEYAIVNRKTGTSVEARGNQVPVVAAVGYLDRAEVHWRISYPIASQPQLTQFQSVSVQGSALDLTWKNPEPGTLVQVYNQNDSGAQTWFLSPTS